MKVIKILLSLLLLLTLILVPGKNSTEAASNIIGASVTVNKVTKNSNGTISINYTMKKDFKTSLGYNVYQSLTFSYSMNSALKITPVSKAVNPKKGTHTVTLPVPSPNYLGTQQVYVNWGSQGRTERDRIGTVYNVPSNLVGLKRSAPHTVTRAEAAAGKIVMDYLPGITAVFVLKGSSATIQNIAKKGIGIATAIVGFNLATNTFKQMPALTQGQVYHRESQLNTNGTIQTRLLIFANVATYNEFKASNYTKNKLAIYDVSNTATLKY